MVTNGLSMKRKMTAVAAIGVLLVAVALQPSSAETSDRIPPSEEVCSNLEGAAFGLCNAYCEALDCDVNPGPGCEPLRRNFAEHTGSEVFPCDTCVETCEVRYGFACPPYTNAEAVCTVCTCEPSSPEMCVAPSKVSQTGPLARQLHIGGQLFLGKVATASFGRDE
jgi:hypothetical protein